MIHRNLITEIENWAKNPKRKPLVLRGARQVGKTTLVNEFAKRFDHFVSLNLEKRYEALLFEESNDIREVIAKIFLFKNIQQDQKRTLIFIDEIQNSPKAVAMLRYFYEEFPQFHVIAAGSLLETLMDTHISFPVGRVQYMTLRPCSFSEFLGAIGKTELKKATENLEIPFGMNELMSDMFKTYSLIGGMPEVVSNFAEHQDIVRLTDIYNSLLVGYKDDVEKYARTETQKNIIRLILSVGWTRAAQQISLGNFAQSAYRAREVGEAFRTLEKTHVVELSYPTTSAVLPILPETKRKPKLFWFDTGLVNFVAGVQQEILEVADLQDAWRGNSAEQIVAQELISSTSHVGAKRYFWVRGTQSSSAEVDFVQNINGRLIPIEVKSGHNAHLRSLHQFMNASNQDIAVRVWNNPLSIDEVKTQEGKIFKLYNVPYYYVEHLDKLLGNK
ncbi:MAG TPA: AAA family ATPase [Paludibacter sp.]|jgi:predicted AAA+ superfamily ATPase|nr:AAA family ATPase [Paludibacter sp.]HPM09160.1 AAA family ATPase [Paludibacter sp.]